MKLLVTCGFHLTCPKGNASSGMDVGEHRGCTYLKLLREKVRGCVIFRIDEEIKDVAFTASLHKIDCCYVV
ncbi:hypothetical protein VNO77_14492 [Canavalia gladiata]|uniref:Uncharacterized protein n=1 Tax=Canavalia gladiata TaxID=3824 RepID=A0AAN9M3I5_CANGL